MNQKCKSCGYTEFITKEKGNQVGLYCAGCGKWIKWLSKEEQKSFNNKEVLPSMQELIERAYQQGLKDAYELNDDKNKFINEIIRLCKDDGNDDVLKEVLCRKLFKYGFIKFVNGSYILQECEYRKEKKNG